MKRLKLFFACLLMAVLSIGQVWADDTPTEFSWAGSATDASGTTDYVVTESPITLTFSKGTSQNAPRTNKEGAVRMYTGTTLTISSSAGNITRVVFTPTTNSYQATNLTYNSTALTGNDWTLSSPAASVTLTATANARFKSMVVYTANGGGDDPVAVTGVSLNKSETSIAVGETETLTATIEPSNATVKTVSWSSSDESVATVDGGVVTAVAEGTATITVASTEDATKKATCAVTVTAAPAASNWQVIAPENLATGDVVVLTMNVGGTYYAAANNNGTSNPPSATSVAVTGSNLSATPATTLQWTVTVVSEGVFQFAVGDKKMYCTDTNNGVRVGTDPTSGTFCNTFDIATENSKFYLHTTATMTNATSGRYLGIYNSQDWRCYSSVNNNIKGGSLVIFKENDNREAAGLEFATKQYLIKKNATFSAPELINPNSLPVTYLSSNTDVAEVAANGAITIKADATGAATITASFGGDETYKDGSASYTIFVAEKAGTNVEGEILTEAIAKELIDLGCTLDVYVTGTILTPQYYDQSKTYTVTLTDGFQFYYFYAGPNETTFDEDILTAGDVLVAYGNLKKSGNNYRLNPCYMVSREPYSEPKVDISNTEATAYTPAQAIVLYNDVTSDLTKTVYVKGVVVASPAIKYNSELTDAAAVYNGTYNVYVKAENDDSENPTKFEFFRMYADENNSTFADGDIQVGDVIVAKGILSKYNNTYEFAQGCQMVSKKSKATMTFDDLDLVVDDVETLAPKTITLAQASAIVYTIKEGSDDCVTISGAEITATAEGTATIVATLATTDDYIGTSVEFSVTVTAAPVVLTDYYEKVTETSGITDGTYLIVYEEGSLAFNGGLTTLDAESNTIEVAITNDNKIGVTTATEAATFFIDVTAGSILAANGKYIGVSSYGNGLKTSETSDYTNAFAIDGDENAVISIYNATWNKGSEGTMILRYNSASGQTRFRYYKEGGQQPIALYKLANETVKANPELAWSGDVEITLGETFTAPTLDNPHSVEGITFASDNTDLATVTNAGVIELVADATGTAHITASFAGNDDYKAASVSCTIIVNASTPTPAETKNVVIIAEYNSKFYAMTNSLTSGALAAVEVEKDGEKIVIFAEADKAAIQWTMTDNTTTATFQDADDKYLAHTGTGTSLALQDAAEDWTWDSENGCYYAVANRTFFYNNSGVFKNYSTSNLPADKTDYSGAPEIIEIAAEDIILSQKADPELAYDPAEVELTVGDDFTPAVLTYAEGFDGLAAVTYESSNTDLATVEGGVVSLVADATGTATITATFAGNNNYLAGSASYTITVNEAGDDLSGTWTRVTAVAVGQKIIIAGTYNSKTMAMGKQNSNNRAAVLSSLDGDVLTPGAATKVFTLVDAGEGLFAIQASNGKYLNAAGTGNSNYLREADDFEAASAKWTITFDENGANIVATSTDNRNVIRYNSTSNSELFSCYAAGGQRAINIYSTSTPEPPTPDYGSYPRNGLTPGNYATICLPKAGTIEGATLFDLDYYDGANTLYLLAVNGNEMVAGRPYIFLPSGEEITVTYTNNDSEDAGSYRGLVGSYSQQDVSLLAGDNYILWQNAYYLVNSEAYVGANRAYIHMASVPTEPTPQVGQAPRRRVAMTVNGAQTATGMDELNASETPVKVMINGQMYILRGEQMFNANGQLVK